MIETFTGQVFLVVAVAQVVSMWAPSRAARRGTDESRVAMLAMRS